MVMLTLTVGDFSRLVLLKAKVPENLNSDQAWLILLLPFGIATFLFAWAIWRRSCSPLVKIEKAFRNRDWQAVTSLGEQYGNQIQHEPSVRHSLVLALWMLKEQEKAINSIQQLRKEFPEFNSFIFTHVLMFLERNELQTALKLIEESSAELADDPSAYAIAARCFRLLGEVDKMEDQVDKIEEVVSDSAATAVFRCAVAIDQGDSELAKSLWEKADLFAPDDAYVALLSAEIEIRFGTKEAGGQELEVAKKLIDEAPFAFLGAELRAVEALANNDANPET